jgi:hypothetical protein
MKVFEDPKLPLRPQGALEKYLLYTFESRGRLLTMHILTLCGAFALWALTKSWVFGALAAFSLVHLYFGIEARAVCRMIRRVSSCENENG